MRKIVYVIIAIIVLSVILLFMLDSKGTHPTPSSKDDAIRPETKLDRPVYDQLLLELDSTEIYNDSIIYGYWFQPHAASEVNLFLHKNGRFVLKRCDVIKQGTFVKDGVIIRLNADDGWGEESFDGRVFHKHNGTNFYLTDSNEKYLHLVKGSD